MVALLTNLKGIVIDLLNLLLHLFVFDLLLLFLVLLLCLMQQKKEKR